jgi:hypothetical protein
MHEFPGRAPNRVIGPSVRDDRRMPSFVVPAIRRRKEGSP